MPEKILFSLVPARAGYQARFCCDTVHPLKQVISTKVLVPTASLVPRLFFRTQQPSLLQIILQFLVLAMPGKTYSIQTFASYHQWTIQALNIRTICSLLEFFAPVRSTNANLASNVGGSRDPNCALVANFRNGGNE